MRVSDEEKALLDRFSRVTRMSVSKVMREAMRRYSPQLECLGLDVG
jgi:predicted transcriptional regulator